MGLLRPTMMLIPNKVRTSGFLTRLFVVNVVAFLILISGCGQKGDLVFQPKEPEIRFYSINSQNQQRELVLVPGANQAGCHNLPLTRAVYRLAQVGFEFCEVFEEKNCSPSSKYSLQWAVASKDPDKITPTTRITQGAKWLFTNSRKNKVSSWFCQIGQP